MDTYLALPGTVGAEPVGTGTTGLHLCQICTAEPNRGQSGSYVSTVTAVEDRDEDSPEMAAVDKAALESDGSTAVVEDGAELPLYQPKSRKAYPGGGDTNLEFVNTPEGEMGAEDETAPVDSELVADAGTLEFDSLVLPRERTSGGKSHLEFAETGSQVDDAATELLLVSRDAVRCASCSIP